MEHIVKKHNDEIKYDNFTPLKTNDENYINTYDTNNDSNLQQSNNAPPQIYTGYSSIPSAEARYLNENIPSTSHSYAAGGPYIYIHNPYSATGYTCYTLEEYTSNPNIAPCFDDNEKEEVTFAKPDRDKL